MLKKHLYEANQSDVPVLKERINVGNYELMLKNDSRGILTIETDVRELCVMSVRGRR